MLSNLFLFATKNHFFDRQTDWQTDRQTVRLGSHLIINGSNDYLDSDKVANIYFTSDVDVRNRVRDLNEYNKINLNEMRRKNMADDGVFNNSQNSNHNVDNDVESNDSQAKLKDVMIMVMVIW